MKKQLISTFFAFFFLTGLSSALAQSTGTVQLPYLGIKFTIPSGWVGQETEGGYLIGHQTQAGFALMSTMEASTLAQVRAEAQQGFVDQNGTNIRLSEPLEQINASTLGGHFEGTLEHQPVRAYVMCVLNPYGQGVTIMTAATTNLFSDVHKNLALQLARSLQFSKPKTSPEANQWKQKFSNAKLTYMDSYYSSGGSYGGYSTGGGYSTKREIHLCAQGFFRYNSSDYTSVDTGGGFGSSHGSNAGDGTWEIGTNAQGKATLVLRFQNGNVYEYTLSYEDKKTFLNGDRYFVTYASSGADYAPNCY